MAENRVTSQSIEVGIERTDVPGNARLTSQSIEVAILKDVALGGNARVTMQSVEVAVLRTSGNQARSWGFIMVG